MHMVSQHESFMCRKQASMRAIQNLKHEHKSCQTKKDGMFKHFLIYRLCLSLYIYMTIHFSLANIY